MANSLFSQFLDPKSQVSRNGFDRTSRQVFSTKVGLLNTPKQIFTKPGGEYQIDMSQVLRTKPFVEAAFARFDVNYEWFRVHINDLYSDFNRWAAQRGDAQIISDLTLNDQHDVPYFNLRTFMHELFPFLLFDYISSLGEVQDGDTTLETIASAPSYGGVDMLINRRVNWTLTGEIVNDKSNRLLVLYSDNTPFESVAWSIVRNLDMMCYGNFIPWFHLCMSIVAIDGADQSENPINMTFQTFNDIVQKWFACLSSSGQYHDMLNDLIPNVDVNLWRPLAYNKVFDNIYRNAYYDNDYYLYYNFGSARYETTGRYRFPYVSIFNLDDLIHDYLDKDVFAYPLNYPTDKAEERNIPGFFRLCAIFASKYHQYGKDMFTSLLPSTQFGDVSVMTDDRSWLSLQTSTQQGSNVVLGSIEQSTSPTGTVYHTIYNKAGSGNLPSNIKFRFDPALAISILNQRKAEALQRFNENTLRVGGRLKDNFNAHFGAIPKSDLSHSAYYMGSFDGRIDLNPVTSTSSTAYGSLGDMGATGVGVISGDKIRFSTDDFDVLICMMYITKPTEYDAYGVDRFNQILDPWDLPLNEIQNISLHPVDALTVNQFDLSHRERILGYLPAFIQYKTDVDLVHGEFYSQNPFGFPKDGTLDSGDIFAHLGQKGLFSSFVTPKDMLSAPEYLQFLYINPNSVDNVFGFRANSLQATDQFEVNLGIQVYAVEHLSVLGLPY